MTRRFRPLASKRKIFSLIREDCVFIRCATVTRELDVINLFVNGTKRLESGSIANWKMTSAYMHVHEHATFAIFAILGDTLRKKNCVQL